MTNLEGRIIRLELLLQASQDALRKLDGRAGSLEQQARQPLAQMWQGGGGGTQVAYWCKSDHSAPFAGASGTWPTITPTTHALDVYSDVGGTLTLAATAATIRWYFKDACGADKLVGVIPNGDGSYDAVVEACTVNS